MAKKPNTNASGETKHRTTFFIWPSLVKKLDYIAKAESFSKNEDISRTDLVNECLQDFVAKWEKKNGEVPVK